MRRFLTRLRRRIWGITDTERLDWVLSDEGFRLATIRGVSQLACEYARAEDRETASETDYLMAYRGAIAEAILAKELP